MVIVDNNYDSDLWQTLSSVTADRYL